MPHMICLSKKKEAFLSDKYGLLEERPVQLHLIKINWTTRFWLLTSNS